MAALEMMSSSKQTQKPALGHTATSEKNENRETIPVRRDWPEIARTKPDYDVRILSFSILKLEYEPGLT